MQTLTIYRYTHEGITTITPIMPNEPYTEMRRLIADENKAITDGEIMASVIDIDVDKLPLWYEIEFVPTEPPDGMTVSTDGVIEDMATLLYNQGAI